MALSRLLQKSVYAAIVILLLCGPLVIATPASAERREVGIATGATLLWMEENERNERLLTIKEELGASWIRVDFSWHLVQPNGPDEYKWRLYDEVVKAANDHGLKILAILAYPPSWGQEPLCASTTTDMVSAQKCQPHSEHEFARFAGAAAARYKGQSIRAWEIWNEPNITGYWKTIQPDNTTFVAPLAYARIANAAAEQIHYIDPDSVIMTGGLAPMFEPMYSRGMRQSDFLAQLLPHLRHDLFDAVGFHPYTWPILPDKIAMYNAFYTVDNGEPEYNLRTVLHEAGWGDKEIWATEFGASTKGLRDMSHPILLGRPDHVTEDVQAQIVEQGIDSWFTKQDVGPLFIHNDSDQWLFERKNEGGYGLRRSDGSKKPAYDAFQRASQRL